MTMLILLHKILNIRVYFLTFFFAYMPFLWSLSGKCLFS